jgi:hypothetical protein
MIQLLDNPLIEKVIWAILSFLTININNGISSKYVTEVNFRNSYFFQSEKTKLIEFYSLDSVSLTKNAARTFKGAEGHVLRNIVTDSAGIFLMRLLKGRFYIGTDPFRIDIAIMNSDTNFNISVFDRYDNYLGDIVWNRSLLDTAKMEPETKELYHLLGNRNFNIIFTFLHEVSHFTSFVNANPKKEDGKWFVNKKKIKNEWETDREAERLVKLYLPDIKEIYKTYKVPEKEISGNRKAPD